MNEIGGVCSGQDDGPDHIVTLQQLGQVELCPGYLGRIIEREKHNVPSVCSRSAPLLRSEFASGRRATSSDCSVEKRTFYFCSAEKGRSQVSWPPPKPLSEYQEQPGCFRSEPGKRWQRFTLALANAISLSPTLSLLSFRFFISFRSSSQIGSCHSIKIPPDFTSHRDRGRITSAGTHPETPGAPAPRGKQKKA